MKRNALLAVIAYAIAGASPACAGGQNMPSAHEPIGFGEIWAAYGNVLVAQNIPRDLARLAYFWTEGQYHLGYCSAFIEDKSENFYRRSWWRKTPLEMSGIGRAILDSGDDGWFKGTQDASGNPPSAELCKRTVKSWFAEFESEANRWIDTHPGQSPVNR